MYHDVTDIFGNEDKICIAGDFEGTHEGELLGIPPTGKKIKNQFCEVLNIKKGKIISSRVFNDSLSLFQQLGQIVFKRNNQFEIKQYLDTLKKLGLLTTND